MPLLATNSTLLESDHVIRFRENEYAHVREGLEIEEILLTACHDLIEIARIVAVTIQQVLRFSYSSSLSRRCLLEGGPSARPRICYSIGG